MKKILIILLFIMTITKVSANEDNKWVDYMITGDNIQVETQVRYRFYQEKTIGEYRSFYEDNSEFPIVDTENLMLKKETYDYGCIERDYVKTTYLNVYPYYKFVDANYIVITATNNDIIFDELIVYEKEERIDYEIISSSLFDEENNHINKSGYVVFKLNRSLKIEYVKLEITGHDNTNQIKVEVFYDDELKKIIGSIQMFQNQVIASIDSKWELPAFYYEDELKYAQVSPNTKFHNVYSKRPMCKQEEYYPYYSKVIKVYADGYHQELDSYIKDEEDFKVYYRYKVIEEKHPIKQEEIVLTDKGNIYNNNLNEVKDNKINNIIPVKVDGQATKNNKEQNKKNDINYAYFYGSMSLMILLMGISWKLCRMKR